MARATVPAGSTCGQTRDDILSLPFVRDLDRPRPETGSRRHFWTPRCEGLDFAAGCDLGQDYALQALGYMAAERFTPLLGWVALDLAARPLPAGERGAVVGFFGVFAELALVQADGGTDRIGRAFAERRARLAAFGLAGPGAGA